VSQGLFQLHRVQRTIVAAHGEIEVYGAASPDEILSLRFDPGLCRFRSPARQHSALAEIAALTDGGVFIAKHLDTIVGYCTFHPPDHGTRWGDSGLDYLLEMGAIEVSPTWRYLGIGKALLHSGFENSRLEGYVVISTEFWWHWDLTGSEMELWEYRSMLADVMRSVGLVEHVTDDPDIASHPINMLSVRIGSKVTPDSRERFESVCRQGGSLFG
jgi:acetoin utilization protein AcuA